jgi:hypothetical protein
MCTQEGISAPARAGSQLAFCLNNPMRFIDPDGMSEEDEILNGGEMGNLKRHRGSSQAYESEGDQLDEKYSNQLFSKEISDINNSLNDGESVTINFGAIEDNLTGKEWISYDGQNVNLYAGNDGDKSNVLYKFKGSSGLKDETGDYRNSKFQKMKDAGPVPNGG